MIAGSAAPELRADCARCAGLCCVAAGFSASADFAIDKPAGEPCPNLDAQFRCQIHGHLRDRGFAGCAAYDCFGAGQHVTQVTFGGRSWLSDPDIAGPMFEAFTVMRQLHELLWYLPEGPLRGAIADATAGSPDDLLGLDIAAYRRQVESELALPPVLAEPDLIGRDLRSIDLRGANLRGAYLVGADLRGVDLTEAVLLGADLRVADLRGTRLTGARLLTQFQLNAAIGDHATSLPAWAERPSHWA